ncbi:MAG TPA: choice-of-anchor Q domain-containing protein [Kofleriaceae bacterium]|jgi:hypothetical protein
MRTAFVVLAVLVVGCGGDDGATSGDDTMGDDGPQCADSDGDGVTTCDGDCDDTNALVAPGMDELCGDNLDNNCNMQTEEGCEAGVGTFVSAITGNDNNAGTLDKPVKTISKGISNAQLLGGARTVVIAEGTYTEKVRLIEGIDLLGGHQCDTTSCTFTRDITAHPTVIAATDFEGVLAGPTITQETLLSGLTLLGFGGNPTTADGSAAITLAGGSPTLRGNKITGGNVGITADAKNISIGVAVHFTTNQAGAVIENNEITGGQGLNSFGIAIQSTNPIDTALVHVRGNVIRSSAARRSVAVLAMQSANGSELINNDITSGASMGGISLGVHIGSDIVVDSNRVNLDRVLTGVCASPTTWCAGIGIEGSDATVTNNIVLGPRGFKTAGLLIAEITEDSGDVLVANNYLGAGGTGTATGSMATRSASAAVTLVRRSADFSETVGTLRNNIFEGGINSDRYGVFEDPDPDDSDSRIHPVSVDTNDFTFASQGSHVDTLYHAVQDFPLGTSNYTNMTLLQTTGPGTIDKNITDAPKIDATYHLMTGSPCIDVGTDDRAPAKDFDGDDRPSGDHVDIGPDEYQ